VPSSYQPPRTRRAQAVRSARRAAVPRWWWLVPLIGIVPVMVAAVLASEGRLGGTPVASRASATAVQATSTPAAARQATPTAARPAPTTVSTQAAQAAAQPTPPPASTQISVPIQAAPASPATATPTSAASGVEVQAVPAGAAQATTAGPFRAYRVQPGDTVKSIAQSYGVSAASIAQASGLRNPDQLRVGQLLTIPSQPGYLYRVRPGETLGQIAARTGVASDIIAMASALPAEMVQAGDVILIPERGLVSRK
jgi:LysM repeat protein